MNQIAVSSNTGASVPISALASQRIIEAANRARAASSGMRHRPIEQTTTAGGLVARPDLSEEAVLKAIAERMTFEGRDASKARAVLDAALAGRPLACAFMRRLVLPPPQSSLQMPIQSILREPAPEEPARESWLSRLSFGR